MPLNWQRDTHHSHVLEKLRERAKQSFPSSFSWTFSIDLTVLGWTTAPWRLKKEGVYHSWHVQFETWGGKQAATFYWMYSPIQQVGWSLPSHFSLLYQNPQDTGEINHCSFFKIILEKEIKLLLWPIQDASARLVKQRVPWATSLSNRSFALCRMLLHSREYVDQIPFNSSWLNPKTVLVPWQSHGK